MCPHGKARWRHLVNTTEPSVCGGDAALCQEIHVTLVECDRGFDHCGVACLLLTPGSAAVSAVVD